MKKNKTNNNPKATIDAKDTPKTAETVNSDTDNNNTANTNPLDSDVESILAEIRNKSAMNTASTTATTKAVAKENEKDESEELVDITEITQKPSAPAVATSTNNKATVKKAENKNTSKEKTVNLKSGTSKSENKKSNGNKPTAKQVKTENSQPKKNHNFIKVFCGLLISVVLAGGSFVALYKLNPDYIPVSISANVPGGIVKPAEEEVVFLKGIQVAGIDLGGKTIDEAKSLLAVKGTTLISDIKLTVNYEEKDHTFTNKDLDFSYNINKAVEDAYSYNQKVLESDTLDIVTYAPSNDSIETDIKKETVNFKVDYQVTQSSVQKVIKRLAKKVDIPVIEPHVSKFKPSESKNSKRYKYKEGSNGTAIDQDALISQAISALEKGETDVKLTATSYTTKPTLKMDDVKKATKLIGKFSTITTNTYNANQNMATALKAINGSILEPGGTLSFNECTGDSNQTSNGYLPAGVISRGEMTTGVGGGICQAATTLYNAAIMANMEIVEREPHLWCSYYVYGGLDATIDWGNIDLKIKNNSKYQMFFKCWMDGSQLNVEIYGWQSPDFDEVRTETELDWYNSEHYGYNSYRVFYKKGKKLKREELPYSTYSLSNGGGIRGADPGDVSRKLKQPD